jgi:ABC-type sugar transport system ATPase subunit
MEESTMQPKKASPARSSRNCPAATIRCWAGASKAVSICPAANGKSSHLARAYLRDAQLLILDEPTASLDARSEFEVFERFAELTSGKMALLISHRFSTVRMADRIVVLEEGRLVEEGSHEQLMALGGRYANMFEMQAASYR